MRRVVKCSLCSPQGWTKANCPECGGFGEYWLPRSRGMNYGFVPVDASRSMGCNSLSSAPRMDEKDVVRARALFEQGWTDEEIGKELGLTKYQVRKGLGPRRSTPKPIRLTDEQVEEVRQARNRGVLWRDLAEQYGVLVSSLQDYMRRRNIHG